MTDRGTARGNRAIPSPRVLVDDVYQTLLSMLMSGDIAPGDRASIDALARELEVSATPIREALVRLEAEGLVVKSPRKGYTAAPLLDGIAFQNLFEMRLLLEPVAARRAAPNLGRAQVGELAASIDAMTRTARGASPDTTRFADYRSFAEADAFFHTRIAEASGNPFIADAIGRLRAHTHLYRMHYSHDLVERTAAEHLRVLTALRERRTEAAESAMREHIELSRDRFALRLG